jgi:hypothetical protein
MTDKKEKKTKVRPKALLAAFLGAVENTEDLDIHALTKVRKQYSDEEKLAGARKDGADVRLQELLWAEGIYPGSGGFKTKDNLSASLGIKETKTISRAKLILAGVDPDVIDAATVTTYSDPFVSVRAPKAKGDGDDAEDD